MRILHAREVNETKRNWRRAEESEVDPRIAIKYAPEHKQTRKKEEVVASRGR
jgi:hypothetical protein